MLNIVITIVIVHDHVQFILNEYVRSKSTICIGTCDGKPVGRIKKID